jgi:hypothetical protein
LKDYYLFAGYLLKSPFLETLNRIDWIRLIFYNFVILYQYIDKKSQKSYKLEGAEDNDIPNFNNIRDKVSPFNVINFNEVKSSLKKITTEIIDHKFAAFFFHFLYDMG